MSCQSGLTSYGPKRAEGHRFLGRLAEDWVSGTMQFDQPGEAFAGRGWWDHARSGDPEGVTDAPVLRPANIPTFLDWSDDGDDSPGTGARVGQSRNPQRRTE